MLLTLSVLVVDDHPIYRDGLADALRSLNPSLCVHTACSAADALERLRQDPGIDLMLADYRLPDGDGLSLVQQARSRWPTLACVLVSGVDEPGIVGRAEKAGCLGCLSKMLDARAVMRAIAGVMRGERHFMAYGQGFEAAPLTERQAAVLQLVCGGRTNKEIARELGITARTVKDHLSAIFARLGVASRAEAVGRAAAQGLIVPQRASR